MPDTCLNLATTYLRLRADTTAEPLIVNDTFWQRLMAGELGTFHREYLVTSHGFDGGWAQWEMHPNGDEIVCLLAGSVKFVLEESGGPRSIELAECGDYVIVPRGTWHTATAASAARLLFITPGEGTEHRPA